MLVPYKYTATEARKERRRALAARDKVFMDVAKKVYDYIQRYISAFPAEDRCSYEIPRYLVGLPLYDRYAAAAFVSTDLRKRGFGCSREDFVLHISWEEPEDPDQNVPVAMHLGKRVMFID